MGDDDSDLCGAPTTKGGKCQNPADSCPWHGTDDPPENGRPSKLSYDRQEQIAQDIERGRSMTSAARKAGVTPQTVINWMDRGKSAKEDGQENEYTEFLDRITRAKGQGEEYYFKTVVEMAKEEGDHRFLASLMKQRYPEAWDETETGVDADTVKLEVSERVAESWPELTE